MLKYIVAGLVIFGCGALTAVGYQAHAAAESARVFEIRTYTTPPGRLDDLHRRFREHTMKLFERHGMVNVAYWTPEDPALADHMLVYVLAHRSREAAKQSWAAFVSDPDWQRVRNASEENGKLVVKVESVFMTPTDYSPLQ